MHPRVPKSSLAALLTILVWILSLDAAAQPIRLLLICPKGAIDSVSAMLQFALDESNRSLRGRSAELVSQGTSGRPDELLRAIVNARESATAVFACRHSQISRVQLVSAAREYRKPVFYLGELDDEYAIDGNVFVLGRSRVEYSRVLGEYLAAEQRQATILVADNASEISKANAASLRRGLTSNGMSEASIRDLNANDVPVAERLLQLAPIGSTSVAAATFAGPLAAELHRQVAAMGSARQRSASIYAAERTVFADGNTPPEGLLVATQYVDGVDNSVSARFREAFVRSAAAKNLPKSWPVVSEPMARALTAFRFLKGAVESAGLEPDAIVRSLGSARSEWPDGRPANFDRGHRVEGPILIAALGVNGQGTIVWPAGQVVRPVRVAVSDDPSDLNIGLAPLLGPTPIGIPSWDSKHQSQRVVPGNEVAAAILNIIGSKSATAKPADGAAEKARNLFAGVGDQPAMRAQRACDNAVQTAKSQFDSWAVNIPAKERPPADFEDFPMWLRAQSEERKASADVVTVRTATSTAIATCFTDVAPSGLTNSLSDSIAALLTADGQRFCSAIQVSPTRVATARHCLEVERTKPTQAPARLSATAVSALFVQVRAEPLKRFAVLRIAPGVDDQTSSQLEHDWIILDVEPLPSPAVPLPVADLQSLRTGSEVVIGGLLVGNDLPSGHFVVHFSNLPSCSIVYATKQCIVHGCNTFPGMSGAPIFVRNGNEWQFAGVHSRATSTQDVESPACTFDKVDMIQGMNLNGGVYAGALFQ